MRILIRNYAYSSLCLKNGGDILKKLTVAIVLLFLLASLCGCSSTSDMSELLSYENGDFSAVLRSGDGSEYSVNKSGDEIKISAGDAVYIPKDGCAVLLSEGLEIKLDCIPPAILTVYETFLFDTDSVWKVTKESPGGADVYVCTSEQGTVYISKSSLLPCRAEKNGKTFDIVSFEVIKKAPAE